MAETHPSEQAIFEIARHIESGEARMAYLRQMCGEDVGLEQRVTALLRAYEDSASFLESPPAEFGSAPTTDQPLSERPGTQIGPYRLLQQIGEGGMGVVYLAEQKEPVKRRVALKIIKPGMDTRQVIARFEAERQALAMMDHPNIAKVLDAGTTDSGRPYFVMELVNGLPVTKYCDEQHLTPNERLELFVPICQAVQHAHQKGIIHRDIKPSNILVALYDGQPVPKIIDFGVAKATSQTLTEKTMFTQLGQVVGTVEYMSPEQAERNQLDIDTRSDIYSLGVVLYELLIGETPFDRERLRSAAFEEMLRIIREEEPSKPSTKVTSSQSLPSIAANRRIEPAKLGRTIRGELDWIVMKALEKDRNRRYATAVTFAEDVQRYLSELPVRACPPSARYRLGKFVQRHRVAVLIASLLVTSLLLGLAGTSWQAIRASRSERLAARRERAAENARQAELKQRREAERQRKAARLAEQKAAEKAATAIAINQFIQDDLLAQADPSVEPDRDITLRSVLDRAASKVSGRFQSMPLVEAGIRDTLGQTYLGLGEYEEAGQHFRQALKLRRDTLGNDDEDTLASVNNLAAFYEMQGQYDKAEPRFREVLENARRVLGPDDPNTLICQNNLAWSLAMQGKLRAAKELFLKTYESRQRTLSERHVDTMDSLNDLGSISFKLGEYDEAHKYLKKALDLRTEELGERDLATLGSMNDLAMLYRSQGQFEEAEPLLRKVLAIRREILTSRHPNTILSMGNLGLVLRALGRSDDAEALYREAYQTAKEILAPDHPTTVRARHNLAALYGATGKHHEAELLLRENLSLLTESHAPPSSIADVRNSVAAMLLAQRKFDDGERLLQEAYNGLQQAAVDHSDPAVQAQLIRSVTELIRLYEGTERPAQAEPWKARLQQLRTDLSERN